MSDFLSSLNTYFNSKRGFSTDPPPPLPYSAHPQASISNCFNVFILIICIYLYSFWLFININLVTCKINQLIIVFWLDYHLFFFLKLHIIIDLLIKLIPVHLSCHQCIYISLLRIIIVGSWNTLKLANFKRLQTSIFLQRIYQFIL